MPLYEIVKADGTREKVGGTFTKLQDGALTIMRTPFMEGIREDISMDIVTYAPGTWLEVWRREGVGE